MLKKLSAFIAVALVATACKDSTPPLVPTTVVLSTTAVSIDAIGAEQVVKATVNDQNGNPMTTAHVTWTSSAPAIASALPASPTADGPADGSVVSVRGLA